MLWELWPQLGWQLIPKTGQKQRRQSRKLQMAWSGECWREELLPARIQLQRAHGSLARLRAERVPPRGRARRHPRDSSTPGRWHRTALGAQREGGMLQNSGKRFKRALKTGAAKGNYMGKGNGGSGFASGMGRGRRKGLGVQGPIPGDESSECVEKKKETFPGFASWITSQCPRDAGCEQTPAQPAKQQCQPPGRAELL